LLNSSRDLLSQTIEIVSPIAVAIATE
jgi:hypothetical protein